MADNGWAPQQSYVGFTTQESYAGFTSALHVAQPSSAAAALVVQPVDPPPPPAPAQLPIQVHTEPPLENGHWYVMWQSEDSPGLWIDYEPDFMHKLESHLVNVAQLGDIMSCKPKGNVTFEYNVVEMWQLNTRSQKKRPMRRMFWPKTEYDKQEASRALVVAHNEEKHDPRRGMQPTRPRSRPRSTSRGPPARILG